LGLSRDKPRNLWRFLNSFWDDQYTIFGAVMQKVEGYFERNSLFEVADPPPRPARPLNGHHKVFA